MKKFKFLAVLATAAAIIGCSKSEAEQEQEQKKEDVQFSLSDSNIEIKGLDYEYVLDIDNSARTVEIYADYLDAENLKALDVAFKGLGDGVTVAYTEVYNYSAGSQTVTFTKEETEFAYTFSAKLGDPSPEFLDLTVAGVAVAGGEVKLSGSTNLTACPVVYTVSPSDTKVYVGSTEVASGDAVDFSDKVNGVNFTLKCASVEKTVNVKVVTTGINSITRVWGHYVKPDSCTDDWFGTKVTGTLDMIRNVAMTDEYVFLSKDKEKLSDGSIDRAGCYAVKISDPSDVKLLSREGFDDNTRFFGITSIENTVFLPTFVMAKDAHLIIYKYESVTSDPVVAVDYVLPEAMRLGDKITSEGTMQDGKLWLYDHTSAAKVLCFTVSGGKVSSTPTVVDLDSKMGSYGGFYKYDETHYACSCASGAQAMFTVSGTTGTKEFEFLGSKYGTPIHGIEFFTINDENYMAYVNLRNSFQDGQFRVMPLVSGDTLESTINCESNPYVYYLGDPEAKEDGTRVKNGNGLGSGDFRTIDGHNYYAAYVPGTGVSLFEIK